MRESGGIGAARTVMTLSGVCLDPTGRPYASSFIKRYQTAAEVGRCYVPAFGAGESA